MSEALLDELSSLEAELHHPGAACTRERLETLLHPAFHEVGRSGRAYDRDSVIAFLLPHRASDHRVDAFDYRVHALGADAALLTYRSRHVDREGRVTHAAHRSSVWRRTARGWRLFYHQGTPSEEA